ncbi:hypothetical protein HY572_06740 [Candidatus Micrarchaeota archaeon]|nr:hypothetical protein [Candidatus Micrarchaeota archaeon]
MAFGDVIKAPLRWLKEDPVLFLPAILTWIPLILAAALALAMFGPFISGLLSSGDASQYFLNNAGQILGLVVQLFILILVVGVASFFIGVFVNLAYAYAAKQKHDGQKLSLSDAFREAKTKLAHGIWSQFLGGVVYGAAFLVLIILVVAAIFSASIPAVGILIAVLLGLVAAIGLLALIFLGSATFYYLMPQIAFSDMKGFSAFKTSWNLVWKYKLQSVALVLLLSIVSNILSQIATAALSTIWLFVILFAIVSLFITAWVALTAAEFWLVYSGGSLPKSAPTPKQSTPAEAKKPDYTKTSTQKPVPKPAGRTVKVKVVPKKK